MSSTIPQRVSSVRHSSSRLRSKRWICLGVCGGLMMAVLTPAGCSYFSRDLSDEQKCAQIEKLYGGYRRKFPRVAEITTEELLAARTKGNVVIVDVRKPAEQEVSMIPGAISSSQFEQEADQYRTSTIVTYCTLGGRGGLYAKDLREKGYAVSNLRGGMLAWVHAGQNVVDNTGPTHRVYMRGAKRNLLPNGYAAAW